MNPLNLQTGLWAELCPPLQFITLKFSAPVTRSVTVFGDRTFREVVKVQRGHTAGIKSSMTAVAVSRGDSDTDTHRGRTT